MNKVCIVIAGAGELGNAVGLFFAKLAPVEAIYFLWVGKELFPQSPEFLMNEPRDLNELFIQGATYPNNPFNMHFKGKIPTYGDVLHS